MFHFGTSHKERRDGFVSFRCFLWLGGRGGERTLRGGGERTLRGWKRTGTGIGEEDGQPYELCHMLTPLNPLWEEGTMQAREVKVDLGGGPLTIRYRYGRIIGNEENMLYYMGNLETSGAEIRVNGRLLCSGLQREIWGRRGHPDYNHFLVQVDLHSENAAALPETETTKTGFQTGTRMFRTLKRWLKRSVILPKNTHKQRERELVNLLEENGYEPYKSIEGLLVIYRKK